MRTASVIAVSPPRNRGFSLVEAVVGMALLGLVCMALFSGLCNSTFSVHMTRENLQSNPDHGGKAGYHSALQLEAAHQRDLHPRGFHRTVACPGPIVPAPNEFPSVQWIDLH